MDPAGREDTAGDLVPVVPEDFGDLTIILAIDEVEDRTAVQAMKAFENLTGIRVTGDFEDRTDIQGLEVIGALIDIAIMIDTGVSGDSCLD